MARPLSTAAIRFQKEFDEKAFEKYKDSATKPLDHFKKAPGELTEVEKPKIVSVSATQVSNKLMDDAKEKNDQDYLLPHPIWSEKEVKSVEITHRAPEGMSDKAAFYCVMLLRKSFDLASGYTIGNHFKMLDERSILIRCIFLETVAGKTLFRVCERNFFNVLVFLGVPGFAAAMIRHLHSLRRMQRDHGWIHTLLEEAENERMHLMTFMQLRRPGPIFRGTVIMTQWLFTFTFSFAYLLSPNFCHR